MQKFLSVLSVTVLGIGVIGCDVDQTEPGRLPDVDVEGDPGNMPEYDVETPEVDIDTEQKEVEVPDVDVEMEKKKVNVPDIDVSIPEDDNE